MEHARTMERRDGVDVRRKNQEPLNGVGRVGVNGRIDKLYSLEKVMVLAYEIRANIITKAGPYAMWY